MALVPIVIVEPQFLPVSNSILYTSTGWVRVDAATVTNVKQSDVDIDMYITPDGVAPGDANKIVYKHRVRPSDADVPYLLPEFRGKLIPPGTQIWGMCSGGSQAVIHMTGLHIDT